MAFNLRTTCYAWLLMGLLGMAFSAVAQESPGELKAVPGQAEIDRSLKDIRELFPEAYATTAKPAKKLEVAATMLATARDSAKIDAGVYTLLVTTRDVAIECGNVELAEEAIQQLSTQYAVNGVALRLEAYAALAKKTQPTPTARTTFVRTALTLVDDAYRQGEILKAAELIKVLPDVARGADDKTLTNQIAERRKAGSALYEQQRVAEPALAAVQAKTATPAQKSIAGRYLCLLRNDWTAGLKLLAEGDDVALKAIAAMEAAAPVTSAEQAALGDRWWDYAEAAPEWQKAAAARRAREWYVQALPGLVGVAKLRTQKRLPEMPEAVAAIPRPPVEPMERPGLPMPAADTPVIKADKIVLWNTHNGAARDRGAKHVHVILYTDTTEVYRKENIELPWKADDSVMLEVPLRNITFNRLRVELVDWMHSGGGLNEIEVIRGGKNLAPQAAIVVSDAFVTSDTHQDFQAANLCDGVRDSARDLTGLWVLPDRVPGWVELEWTPVVTSMPAGRLSKLLGYPLRRHPTAATSFGNHWYAHYPGHIHWDEAQRRCKAMGGHLMILNNAEEADYGWTVAKRQRHWIGGLKDASGNWRWVDGSPLQWTNWSPPNPSNTDGIEDRIEAVAPAWNDAPRVFRDNRGFVCEWPF